MNWLSSQFCFELYEAPIAVEPGVGALEINVFVRDLKRPASDPKSRFKNWWRFERVEIDESVVSVAPYIPSTKYPHVFTMLPDLEVSPFLLVYDISGRLAFIFKKEGNGHAWVCHNVIDEVRGRTISQFSVRFAFNQSADRDEFMSLIEKLMDGGARDKHVDNQTMRAAIRLLRKAKMAPVATTVAIEKSSAKV